MHIIIFTRALGGRGHGRMHKGKEEEKGIERLKRKKAGRRGNRSKGGKYEKKVETGVF